MVSRTLHHKATVADTGFAAIPVWMLRDPAISIYAKAVYLALASRADRDGVCWPSQRLMAEELGISETSVKAALSALQVAGAIRVRPEVTERGRRNRYFLLIHPTGGQS